MQFLRVLQEEDRLYGPRVSSSNMETKSLRRPVPTKQETWLEASPRERAEGRPKRTRRIALPQDSPSQALWNGVSFQILSGQSSCLLHIWSDSESFLVMPASLSQDRFQIEELWEIGHLLPPKFSQLSPVFSSNTKLLTETSCCDEASGPGRSWWFRLPVS